MYNHFCSLSGKINTHFDERHASPPDNYLIVLFEWFSMAARFMRLDD